LSFVLPLIDCFGDEFLLGFHSKILTAHGKAFQYSLRPLPLGKKFFPALWILEIDFNTQWIVNTRALAQFFGDFFSKSTLYESFPEMLRISVALMHGTFDYEGGDIKYPDTLPGTSKSLSF
jgi:hypothetical protein